MESEYKNRAVTFDRSNMAIDHSMQSLSFKIFDTKHCKRIWSKYIQLSFAKVCLDFCNNHYLMKTAIIVPTSITCTRIWYKIQSKEHMVTLM